MAEQEQQRLQTGDEPGRVVAGPHRDDALLQVLFEIRDGLRNLEDHLKQQPAMIDSKLATTQPMHRAGGGESLSEAAAKSSGSGDDVIREDRPKLPETKYYQIADEKFNTPSRNRLWVAMMDYNPPLTGADIEKLKPLQGRPIKVWDPSWSYYKLIYEGIDGNFQTCSGGQGRTNFLAPWRMPGYKFQDDSTISEIGNPDSKVLYIPYSSTPPREIFSGEFRLKPFEDPELSQVDEILKGMGTIPPDWRVNLYFQYPVIQYHSKRSDTVVYAKEVRRDLEALDWFAVLDIDASGSVCCYSLEENRTAEAAEEWFLKIPPRKFYVANNWTFHPFENGGTMNWNRIVLYRGLVEVYRKAPWYILLEWVGLKKDVLFTIHSTCRLKANDVFHELPRNFFHMCWMDIQQSFEGGSLHNSWKRHSLVESSRSIGTVCASMQYIPSGYEDTANDYWTLLVLVPKGAEDLEVHFNAPNTRLLIMLSYIEKFHKMAYVSWVELGNHFEAQLSTSKTSDLVNRRVGDDEIIKASMEFFRIINKMDEILAIITDAKDQWEWFWATNEPFSIRDNELWSLRCLAAQEHPDEWKETQRVYLADRVRNIEDYQRRLMGCYDRFNRIRETALSLREGIFNLTSVKEAIEARHLGENVKLLTYVTIFYLPPAYCVSLWGINGMFGTGTTGFAIITVVISLLTYFIVAGLLHLKGREKVVDLWARKGIIWSDFQGWFRALGSRVEAGKGDANGHDEKMQSDPTEEDGKKKAQSDIVAESGKEKKKQKFRPRFGRKGNGLRRGRGRGSDSDREAGLGSGV